MKSKWAKTICLAYLATLITSHSLITTTLAVENYSLYTVISGDTLWKISNKYDVTIQEIIDFNHLTDTTIMIGQQLKIPNEIPENTTEYIVKSGDALWKIAAAHDVTVQEIVDINGIDPNKYLYVGQRLYIPDPISNQPYITYIEHIVQSGDNPWKLGIKYGIPMNEILQANNLTQQSVLYIGQKLTIPVHNIPVTSVPGPNYGEYLDWWSQAQYVFPVNAKAKVTDVASGKSYNIVRSTGAYHADCEPLTAEDASIMYEIWGNKWSWTARAVIVEVNGRKIAASASNMPHDVENIKDNNFNGHFDLHFLNSTRHSDGQVSPDHQAQIKIAAGIK